MSENGIKLPTLATKFLLRPAPDSDRISASKLSSNSMFIHHVNGIDWLVITAFEELKPIFIEDAGAILLLLYRQRIELD